MSTLKTKQSSLALRLFRRTIFYGVMIILLLAAARAGWEYRSSMRQVNEQFKIIEETVAQHIAADLWDLDQEKLLLQMQSLCNFPFITYAAVRDGSIIVAEAGEYVPTAGKSMVHEFPLSIQYKGQNKDLGMLFVQNDGQEVVGRAVKVALAGIAIDAGFALLVACMVFMLMNKMVFQHLGNVANHFQSFRLNKTSPPLVLDKTDMGDELDVLAAAVNTMQEGLSESYAKLVQAHDELQQSEARFRKVVEHAPDGIVVVDADDLTIVDANENALRHFGCSFEELCQRGLRGYFPAEQPDGLPVDESIRKNIRICLKEGSAAFERAIHNGKGEDILCEVRLVNLPSGDKSLLLASFTDITERKRGEVMLLQAKDAAVQANKAKSMFLANMSHEIRTPLNGVLCLLQLLETTETSEEQTEYVLGAITSAKRLTRLLSDILDISRVEAGKMEILERRFDLHELVWSTGDLFNAEARGKQISLEVECDAALPRFLVGDDARLRQILFNLVGNAIKYTEQGEVRLNVSVLPEPPESMVRVLFVVSDTGIGIPDKFLEDIFQPFMQAEEGAFNRHYQGAGLGLSIVSRLVTLMDGNISIDSLLGKGTTIYVSLLFRRADESDTEPQPEIPCSAPVAKEPLRILLAEDDDVCQLTAQRLLEKSGYLVTAVKNGQEAVQLVHEQDFDVVLLDVQMPVLDGVAATRAIRESTGLGEKSKVPIIAMTAYAMMGDKERFLKAGMDGYLSKPVERKTLLEEIERLLASCKDAPSQS